VSHAISTVGGTVPADERLRLVQAHGAEKAAELIEAREAELAPAQEQAPAAEPTSRKRGRAADPSPETNQE
jgi:hypothetical protein